MNEPADTMTRADKEPLPFKRGDRVIDDDGETGTVVDFVGGTWNPEGRLTHAAFTVRPDWDQPSYGKEKRLTRDQMDALTPL